VKSKKTPPPIRFLRIVSPLTMALAGLLLWLALVSRMSPATAASALVPTLETGESPTLACPADMIAYWNLDETTGNTFKDLIADNDGHCTASTCPSPVTGVVNGAYNFDGSSGIDIPALSPDFSWDGKSNFSIALWVKIPETENCPGTRVAISRYAGYRSWWVGCSDIETAIFSLRDSEQTAKQVTGTTSINNGQWHYLVAVRDGAEDMMHLYVNGILESSESQAFSGNWISSQRATIGYHQPHPYYHLVGIVDEAAVFNRALQLPEILHYYSNGLMAKGYCSPLELLLNTVGEGIVETDPAAPYGYGQGVTLTAMPLPGWSFDSWNGAVSGSANPITTLMTEEKAITATFTMEFYNLTVNTTGNGSVTVEPPGSYAYGQQVTLTATTIPGWSLANWSGAASGSANPLIFVITGDQTVTATFTADLYDVTVNTSGNGSVSVTPPGPYTYDRVITLTAVAATGWTFGSWSGDVSGAANPITTVMNHDKTITATFTANFYGVTVNTSGNGSVSVTPPGPYTYGQVVTLTATAASGWTLANWSGDASGNANPLGVVINGHRSITAVFVPADYRIYLPFTSRN
jgi:hypothetical protein